MIVHVVLRDRPSAAAWASRLSYPAVTSASPISLTLAAWRAFRSEIKVMWLPNSCKGRAWLLCERSFVGGGKIGATFWQRLVIVCQRLVRTCQSEMNLQEQIAGARPYAHRDSPASFYGLLVYSTDSVAERNSGHGCANGDLSSGDVTAAAHLAAP